MIEAKQKEIINKLNNSDEIKRFKMLEKQIKSNKEYNLLIEEFNKNKDSYEKENRLNEEIINLRKKLFMIDGVKEYLSLEKEIRLFSKKTSSIISSVIEHEKCK